jgi:DNA-binding CsgD family transcriptional regulator
MVHQSITVSIAGGHELDRAGLEALISSLPRLRAIPSDSDPPPQVLIWIKDKALSELPHASPGTAILLLTDDAELESLPETVTGLFSRDEQPVALGIAIRQVARREQYLSPSLATAILEKRQSNAALVEDLKLTLENLTEREREILDLLAKGLSNKLIAAQMYLSVRTVEGHLANIYSRLGVHSRTEAMLIAVKIPKSPAGTGSATSGLRLHSLRGQV